MTEEPTTPAEGLDRDRTDADGPFRSLADPTPPVDPNPRFARALTEAMADAQAQESVQREVLRRLRGRVATARASVEAPIEPAADERRHTPVRVPTILVATEGARTIPYLCVQDGSAAIDWYLRAFGATVALRVEDGDGRIGHAELRIGSVPIYLAAEFPDAGVVSPATLGNTSVTVVLELADVDGAFLRAAEAGAEIERVPTDQPHGHRVAVLRDPFGHRWMLSARVEDVSVEEYAARERSWFVTGSDGGAGAPKRRDEPPF